MFFRNLGANLRRGSEPDFGRLLVMLRDRNFEVVSRAAEALAEMGKQGDRRAVQALIDGLKEKNEPTRTFSASALGKAGDPEAVGPLIEALRDDESDVRTYAAQALGQLGEPALQPLLDLLGDEDEAVRFHAACALTLTNRDEVQGRLKEALTPGDTDVRRVGAYSLYADYYQFYLQAAGADPAPDTGARDFWSKEALERKLAVVAGIIGVSTLRYDTEPVQVEVHERDPGVALEKWDHVVEGSLAVPSGSILIDGCLSLSEDSPRIPVAPGSYRVRVMSGGLGTVVSDQEGEDHYRVVMWPKDYEPPRVLKAWAEPGGRKRR